MINSMFGVMSNSMFEIMILLVLFIVGIAILLLLALNENGNKKLAKVGFIITLIIANYVVFLISPIGYVILTVIMCILAIIFKLCKLKNEFIKIYYNMVKLYFIAYLIILIPLGLCLGLMSMGGSFGN